VPDPFAQQLLHSTGGPSLATDPRWREVEEVLGISLPQAYKSVVQRFPGHHWSGFLSVLDPFSVNQHLNLQQAGTLLLDAERSTRSECPHLYPLPLYPEPGGLFPWAITDNGDVFFWITRLEPDDWPTLIKGARSPEFEVHFVSCDLLLYQVASGRIRSVVLPPNL